MSSIFEQMNNAKSRKTADRVGEFFKTLPTLPRGIVELLVTIAPFGALLGAIGNAISVPFLLISSVMLLASLKPIIVLLAFTRTIVAIFSTVLLVVAYEPLMKRKQQGWMYLFWSTTLGSILSAIGILLGKNSLVSVLGILFGFYVLYQMRKSYKK